MVEDCSLVGKFGIIVQAILSILVVLVLSAEWIVERFILRTHDARNFYDFWFDSFKICVGAFFSHCINLLVALYLKAHTDAADSCTLYGLSYYYEATGVAFVSLLQYCLVKYSQAKALNSWPAYKWLRYLTRPGKYPAANERGYETRDDEVQNGAKFVFWPFDRDTGAMRLAEKRCRTSFAFSVVLSIAVGLLAGFVSKDGILGAGMGFIILLTAFSFMASPESCWIQVFAWSSIKLFEKSIWAGFVMMQTSQLAEWSQKMTIEDKHLETWLYVAIMPMILNVFMFLMFSNISRLRIPCLELSQQHAEDGYSWQEALKVGIVYSLIMNVALYFIACLLIQDWGAVGVLLGTMVLLPLLVAALFIYFFTKYIMPASRFEMSVPMQPKSDV